MSGGGRGSGGVDSVRYTDHPVRDLPHALGIVGVSVKQEGDGAEVGDAAHVRASRTMA